MLKFISSTTKENGDVEALYDASAKASKEDKDAAGSVYPVRLVASETGATAAVELGASPAPDEEAAFDNLATALERCARAIRERGQANRGVPIYS